MRATVVVVMPRRGCKRATAPRVVQKRGKPGSLTTGFWPEKLCRWDLRQDRVPICFPLSKKVAIFPPGRTFSMVYEEFWLVPYRKPQQGAATDRSHIRCFAGNHLGIVDEEVESPDHVPVNAPGERKERLHQGFCHDGMAEAGRFASGLHIASSAVCPPT